MENPFSKYRKGESAKSAETLFRVMADGAMKIASIEDFRGEKGEPGKKGDSIKGDDGRGVKSLFLKAKNLIVAYTDGEQEDVGVIVGKDGKDGVSIVDTAQNANGELIVYYSNGKEKNCGLIRGKDGENGKSKDGKDGRGIKNCEINEDGEFCIYYTDGTEENHGKIREESQPRIVNGMSSFGVGVKSSGTLIGMGFTNINFTGSGINSVTKSGREVTVDVSGGGGGGGAPTNATYVTLSTNATLTNERVLTAGTGISITDGGAGSTVTVASTITQYTDEMAQDAVGGILVDSSTIDFTYDDGAPSITAAVIDGSLGTAKLGGDITTAGKALLDDADAAAQRTTLGVGAIGTLATLAASVVFVFGDGVNALTANKTATAVAQSAMTITGWTLLETTDTPVSSSAVIDVFKDAYSSYPPTTSITASAKPTLSSATKAQSSTLTGWTTSVSAGDILKANLDSTSSGKRYLLILTGTRTS